jgi:hypothetical protein
MEPISLTVSAIVAALAAKARDRAIDATVVGGEGVLHRLVSRLRARFSDTDDRDATETLELVERMADSPKLVADLAKAVERHVAADASLRPSLSSWSVRRVRTA